MQLLDSHSKESYNFIKKIYELLFATFYRKVSNMGPVGI